MADAAQIAASLSEAQRRALLAIEPGRWQIARRGVFSAVAAFNMVGLGLLSLTGLWLNDMPHGDRGRDHYKLTPLGEQVRAILQGEGE